MASRAGNDLPGTLLSDQTITKNTHSVFREANISGEDEISDTEFAPEPSLEEQITRLQRLVAYLLKKNEQLRQSINEQI